MAAVCETLQVQSDDSEAGALDDLLGLGGALADASDDDNDALVDDAFGRRARGAGASVSGAKGWAVLDDALLPSVAERIRDAAAKAVFKPHKFVYDAQTYAKPGVAEVDPAVRTTMRPFQGGLVDARRRLSIRMHVRVLARDAKVEIGRERRNLPRVAAAVRDRAYPCVRVPPSHLG